MKKFWGFTSLLGVMGVIVLATGCGSNQEPASFSMQEEKEIEVASAPKSETNSAMAAKTTAKASVKIVENTAEAAPTTEGGVFKAFPIYTDENSPDNHFFPSGWMGDYSDLSFDGTWMENTHSGSTCIKLIYSNKATQGARWAGMYWQNPANNWGNRAGGYDLTGASKLVFWARGEQGGERIEEFKVGGITGEYSDSDVAGIGPVLLTNEWKQYVIDLEDKDLSSIIGGFAWSTNLDGNPNGVVFYLDDIRFE